MAIARARRDNGFEAIGRLRRRAVDARAWYHIPSHRVQVVQFYLTQEVTGKDTVTGAPERPARAAHRAAVAGKTASSAGEEIAQMRFEPDGDRDRAGPLPQPLRGGRSRTAVCAGKAAELTGQLEAERRLTTRALAQVEVLNSRSRRCGASSR